MSDEAYRIAELERRLTEQEDLTARLMRNGLKDLFARAGQQRYGGNIMLFGPLGQQINVDTTADVPAIYFGGKFTTTPATTYPHGELTGRISTALGQSRIAIRALGGASHIAGILFTATAADAFGTLSGDYYQWPTRSASDPSSLTDGIAWFDASTKKFRGSFGTGLGAQVIDSFAMEAWVTAATLAATRGNWKVFYSNGSGVFTELALGASGTVLTANGVSSAPTFTAPASSGWAPAITAQTSNYTAVKNDVVNCTSGTFTVTLTASATVGTGGIIVVKNTGSGGITITPAGAETIDGYTTLVLGLNEAAYMITNGSNWLLI
jgi:hypothetical protein